MPFLLETTTAFLNSTATPPVCLFSGRMDVLDRQAIRLSDQISVAVPAAPGEYRRWQVARLMWLWPLMIGAGVSVSIWLSRTDPLLGVSPGLLGIGVLAVSALASGVYAPVSRRDCVRFRLMSGDGRVDVVFPSRREHVFWEYQKAHKAFQGGGSGVRAVKPVDGTK
ncbi:MAG TPA: hypothetical protein VL860_00365 [Planctomycetota bacterium]|nr:hypothetical protein [Planctomycetota bacterium]